MSSNKIEALAKYLECDPEDLSESTYDDNLIEWGREEWLVLTDSEADEQCAEYIRDSLWAFNASFLAGFLPEGVDEEVITMLQTKCEDANPAILRMVGDRLEALTEDAIACDGRGHFLSPYDGNECEEGDFYLYRLN